MGSGFIPGTRHRCNKTGLLGRRRGASAGAAISLLVLFLSAGLCGGVAETLPVLTTARQVHTLTDAAARRGYPVRLAKAQVTFCDSRIGALFLMDSSDGIFADIRGLHPPALRAGDLVAVNAVSGPGKVNPVLLQGQFRILGHAPLPEGPLVSFDRILTGAWDARWISMEGIVRAVRRPGEMTAYDGEPGFGSSNLILTVASGPDWIDVITQEPAAQNDSGLIDARVRLLAAVGSRFNHKNQLIGVHVYTPNLSYVHVLEAPPADPFAIPVTDTADVMRRSLVAPGNRVHIRGVVTASFGTDFSLMDARDGIFVHTDHPAGVRWGDLLDVVGFPSMGDYTAVLDDAVVRRIGVAHPPPPILLTAAEALTGIYDAEPVQLQGQLLYITRGPSEQDLVLSDGGVTFSAILPVDAEHSPLSVQPGARLRLRGICFIGVKPDKTPQSVELLVHSPADVIVLARPSWWTARHALLLSALLTAAAFGFIAWNLVLRRRVRGQTRVITAQLREAHALRDQAETAHREKSASLANIMSLQRDLVAAQEELRYQATHDALTGLWNRGALLDLLRREMERAARRGNSFGLLMLDVDHFKPINDTWGHLAGDTVLREIASRITGAIRAYDIAGRYGGEEFLVILPECDAESTRVSAERIRCAVGESPFTVADSKIALTISIGATVSGVGSTETELLSVADAALYQAKSEGRNRSVLRIRRETAQPLASPAVIG